MSDHDELGSGQIERHPDRPIVHFGSPAGSAYHDHKEPSKHAIKQQPMYRLTKGGTP